MGLPLQGLSDAAMQQHGWGDGECGAEDEIVDATYAPLL